MFGCTKNIPRDTYKEAGDHLTKLMQKEMDYNIVDDDPLYEDAEEYKEIDYNYSDIDDIVKIDLNATEADPNHFFLSLGEHFKTNFIVSPDIKQKITMHLNNASLRTIAVMCYESLGIVILKSDKGYVVKPERLITRYYKLPIMGSSREISNRTDSAPEQNGSSSTINSRYQNNSWEEITKVIERIVNKHSVQQNIQPNPQNASVLPVKHMGMLIVTAPERAFAEINKFMQETKKFLSVQVSIEARIYDIEYNDSTQAGIDWSKLRLHLGKNYGLSGNQENIAGSGVNKYEIDTAGTLILGRSSEHPQGVFQSVFSFLKSIGNTRMVASPKIAILNGDSAILKVGTTKKTIGAVKSNYQSSNNVDNATSHIDFEKTFSGISLYVHVLCTVGSDKKSDLVTLHVKPSYSSTTQDKVDVNIGGKAYNIPISDTTNKDTDTILLVPDNGFIVLSGLEMSNDKNEFRNGQRVARKGGSQLIIILHVKKIPHRATAVSLKSARDYFWGANNNRNIIDHAAGAA